MRRTLLSAGLAALTLAGCGGGFSPRQVIGMRLIAAQQLGRAHGRLVEQVAPLRPHVVIGYTLPPKGLYVETDSYSADSTIIAIMKLRCRRTRYRDCNFVRAR